MPITSEQKETRIRTSVIQAAQQLFRQHGLHKVTMEDVAQAIGKGKSTLYYYYKSKEEIFDAMIELEMTQALAGMQVEVAKADTAIAQLKAFYLTKFRQIRQKVALYQTLSRDVRQQGEFLQQMRKRYYQRETDLVMRILQHGLETGEFSRLAGQDLELTAYVLFSSTQGLEQEVLFEEANSTSEAAIELLLQFLIEGLKT
jgi:AcrR family transcriptional regulator